MWFIAFYHTARNENCDRVHDRSGWNVQTKCVSLSECVHVHEISFYLFDRINIINAWQVVLISSSNYLDDSFAFILHVFRKHPYRNAMTIYPLNVFENNIYIPFSLSSISFVSPSAFLSVSVSLSFPFGLENNGRKGGFQY